MENNTKKRNIFRLFSFRKGAVGAEILCAVILFPAFLFAGFNTEDLILSGKNESSAFISIEKGLADIWQTGVMGLLTIPAGDSFLMISAGGNYANLGNFTIVESEDFAYKNSYDVSGSKKQAKGGIAWKNKNFTLGGTLDYNLEEIPNFYKKEEIIPGLIGKMQISFFEVQGKTEWISGELNYSAGCTFFLNYGKAGLNCSLFYEAGENQVLKTSAGIENSKRDLSFFAEYRQGLKTEVYDPITFRLSKEINFTAYSLYFSPSFTGESLFGASVSFSWKNNKTDEEWY